MSKDFWIECWERLEMKAHDLFVELYGCDPTDEQIKEYCEAHIEEYVRDCTGDAIDHAMNAMGE